MQQLFPPSPFERVLFRRAAVLWIASRLMLLMFGVSDVWLGFPASLALVALVCGLTLFDARRRHETILLGNLGAGPGSILAVAALPAAGAELISWLIAG